AGKDGIHVHLLKYRALVFEFAARHRGKLSDELRHSFPPMSLHHPDDDVLSPLASADCLTQHVVRLFHSWGIAQKQLKYPRCLFRGRVLQPLFRGLRHRAPSSTQTESDTISA